MAASRVPCHAVADRIMARGRPKRAAAKRTRKAARKKVRARHSPRRDVEVALAALAHDVRTPLTGILALSELLAASDIPERERGWAQAIRDAAVHLAQQTSLVLDAVKADLAGLTLRSDAFSPRRLAEAVAASLKARAGTAGLTAEIAISGELPHFVMGDPVRLRAALENLVDNAVKFTARGRITFEVMAEPAAARRVRLRFAVTDSGIGMTKAQIARLFRPFAQASRQVSRRYGGTGLGLVLVRRLAHAMGGDLVVESRPSAGSTFTLTVIVGPASASEGDGTGVVADRSGRASLRILCAEDNPFGRVVLGTMLKELGHSVDFVGSGEAAVNAVAGGGYDLVLMDVTLPGVDGLEATRRIRALPGKAARIRVIGVSGRSLADDADRARAAGMTEYLVKPVSPMLLIEAIGNAVEIP